LVAPFSKRCLRLFDFPAHYRFPCFEVRPLLKNKLAREALVNIAGKAASPGHVGPMHVADFEEITTWKQERCAKGMRMNA